MKREHRRKKGAREAERIARRLSLKRKEQKLAYMVAARVEFGSTSANDQKIHRLQSNIKARKGIK